MNWRMRIAPVLFAALTLLVAASSQPAAAQGCPPGTVKVGEHQETLSDGTTVINSLCQELAPPQPAPVARTYRPSGNALIGGTTWIGAYNVQNTDPKLVAKAREMMAQQTKLAGIPYSDVDFDRYNFVLGIAASTNVYVDVGMRVIFDEFKNGQFSAKEQNLYASLKDRQFNELACHSNGAMICLAALENKDVIADHVVLYGPQVTLESLGMWNELVSSGQVKSVQVIINQNDPVPAVSLLIGGGVLHAIVLRSMPMFMPPSIARVFGEASPQLTVRPLHPCGKNIKTLDCHYWKAYKASR